MLYKVLLAEDEPEVLSAIIRTIRWEEHGFERPLACGDGQEAIEALKNGFVPHLIITDICMPIADGFDLIRFANNKTPGAVVVIISGYDDFKYAQTALKLSVTDYLLKPVTPGQIYEMLDKMKAKLDQLQSRSSGDSEKIVISHFLNRLVSRRMDENLIRENCELYHIRFRGSCHQVALLDVDLPGSSEDQNLELMRFALFNITEELTAGMKGVVVFQSQSGITHLIFSGEAPEELEARIRECFELLLKSMVQHMGLTISGGAGEWMSEPSALHISCRQGGEALAWRFFKGTGSLTFSRELAFETLENFDYGEAEARILSAVRAADRPEAYRAVDHFLSKLRENRIGLRNSIRFTKRILAALNTLARQLLARPSVELQRSADAIGFNSVLTLDQLGGSLHLFCDQLFDLLKNIQTDTATAMVHKAEEYIREHFADPNISLNTVVEHLSVSTSYFSSTFKAKTGMTFLEYLTHLRIEKAKQILVLTDRRTYEVAEDVGYSDPQYFSVAFKRVTDQTPREFRENSRKQK